MASDSPHSYPACPFNLAVQVFEENQHGIFLIYKMYRPAIDIQFFKMIYSRDHIPLTDNVIKLILYNCMILSLVPDRPAV